MHTQLMMTAESMLSKRPVLRFTVAIFFLNNFLFSIDDVCKTHAMHVIKIIFIANISNVVNVNVCFIVSFYAIEKKLDFKIASF